jgi:hypothetical protein
MDLNSPKLLAKSQLLIAKEFSSDFHEDFINANHNYFLQAQMDRGLIYYIKNSIEIAKKKKKLIHYCGNNRIFNNNQFSSSADQALNTPTIPTLCSSEICQNLEQLIKLHSR